MPFSIFMEKIHNNRLSGVSPYQYEPLQIENTSIKSESSSDEKVDIAFEADNTR